MPEHAEIYSKHADRYDLLVTREDYQQNILRAIKRIRPLGGLDVVELGAGTGRLTCMLAALVTTIDEAEAGFSATGIRADYRFRSPAEAEALTRFFFGNRMAGRVVAENLVILTECTGIWWLNVP